MATSTVDGLETLCTELSAQIQTLRNVDKGDDLPARRTATRTARKLLDELIHPEEAAAEQLITVRTLILVPSNDLTVENSVVK